MLHLFQNLECKILSKKPTILISRRLLYLLKNYPLVFNTSE
ncbi:hypothetical protein LEP1GSC073_1510 [Leptospira noguchii str. Cascata]|nr:hypothetical protein LEP1GSC072_1104 [Leptospira noguchii str. Bonito]EMS82248.1 hypothetical protein LEP1GSC073_1510 [Leptospira noguchii str. Cascata]